MNRSPGPWRAEGTAVYSSTGQLVAATGSVVGSMEVEIREANAALIAAAPELLSALERLVSVCQADDIRPHVSGHLELAKAAIAKAKGE